MSVEVHLGRLAKQVGFQAPIAEGNRLEVLAAIRVGAEFARTLPDGGPIGRVKRIIAGWIVTLSPEKGSSAQAVLDSVLPTLSPAWLGEVMRQRSVSDPESPLRFLLVVMLLFPPGYSHLRQSHEYMMAVAEALGLGDVYSLVLAWVERSGDPQQLADFDSQYHAWAKRDDLIGAYVRVSQEAYNDWHAETDARDDAAHFGQLRVRLLRLLDALEIPARDLGVSLKPLVDLREYARADSFRVAVLGEFKRGKSSILNCLLGIRGLMPVDELPCTSTVTAIRYGERLTFERQVAKDEWELCGRDEFHHAVAQAARVSGEVDSDNVQLWRVSAPSTILRTGFLELVDTPGLGEDEARDRVAFREARLTDGAILVLSAEQQASLKEVDIAAELRNRQDNIVIVINKSDLWKRPMHDLVQYVHDRFRKKGVDFSVDRFVPFSATLANPGAVDTSLGEGRIDQTLASALKYFNVAKGWLGREQPRTPPGLVDTDQLIAVVREKILARSVARKKRVMAGRIQETLQMLRPNIEVTLSRRRRNLQEHEQIEARLAEARSLEQAAREGVRLAKEIIEESSESTRELTQALYKSLPSIIDMTRCHESEWTSSFLPLTSPKKHTEEVARKVRASFLGVLEEWFKTSGADVVTKSVLLKLDRTTENLAPLRHYLKAVLGLTEEQASARVAKVEEYSVRNSVDLPVDTGDAVGVALRVALMTVVSLIVGYVIADVVLYYVLSAVSGFLNPFLLAAAVLAAIVAYAFQGDEWVRSSIRNKLLDKIAEELGKPEAREKIENGIRVAMDKYFCGLSASFDRETRSLLEDVAYQTRRIEEEGEKLVRMHGDPEWIRGEVKRLESVANQVRGGVSELEQILNELHATSEVSLASGTPKERG